MSEVESATAEPKERTMPELSQASTQEKPKEEPRVSVDSFPSSFSSQDSESDTSLLISTFDYKKEFEMHMNTKLIGTNHLYNTPPLRGLTETGTNKEADKVPNFFTLDTDDTHLFDLSCSNESMSSISSEEPSFSKDHDGFCVPQTDNHSTNFLNIKSSSKPSCLATCTSSVNKMKTTQRRTALTPTRQKGYLSSEELVRSCRKNTPGTKQKRKLFVTPPSKRKRRFDRTPTIDTGYLSPFEVAEIAKRKSKKRRKK